jgi:hypothetical protein
LPGGIRTRWKTVPLHGAHNKARQEDNVPIASITYKQETLRTARQAEHHSK